MNLPTNHQLIEHEGKPVAVVVPYSDYVEMSESESEITTPQDVVSLIFVKGHNSVQAWREYKQLSQREVAASMKITQSAYSQLEKRGYHKARTDNRNSLCEALGVSHEQLDIANEP